jgi:hypothetical protein
MRSFFYTTVYVWDVQNILNKEKRKKKERVTDTDGKGVQGGGGRQRRERWKDMGSTAMHPVRSAQ